MRPLLRRLTASAITLSAALASHPAFAQAPPSPPAAPAPAFAWEEATVAELQAAMASGKATSRSITEAYLARIRELDPKLHAVLETNPDALAIADALDQERRAKGPRGPLHGIPVLVKDNIATGKELSTQLETTAGSLALVGHKPPRDAFIIARLRAAGAVLLGKTNLSEWANIRSSHSSSGWSARGGLVRNPYALDRTACGSSSGTGAAIAANLGAVGIGTETDGSIVCPASMNGLVGLKPTVGLLSRSGIVPISHTQDTPGPMTRTVADAAALLTALRGFDKDDEATRGAPGAAVDYATFLKADALAGKRIGISRAKVLGLNAAADRVTLAAIEVLKAKGAVIVDPADIPHVGELDEDSLNVLLFELKADLKGYLAAWAPTAPFKTLPELVAWNVAHKDQELVWFGQELFEKASKLGPLTDARYKKSLARCRKLARTEGLEAVFKKHKLDALLVPTGSAPWLIDLINGDSYGTSTSSLAAVPGTPALTVPAGDERGLPLGVTFMGRPFDEGTLLGIGYAYEQATHARRAPKLLPTADLGR